ncbi:MAG: YigZ family protein [Asgard group archaeon]|nr:hypothetical protein JTP64_006092 [Candida tropicalis]MCP8720113.1 YigZ family protein [Asgard group archaeon]
MFKRSRLLQKYIWNASEVIIDRKSKFQARHVELNNPDDIPEILKAFLKEHKSISRAASHPHMLAWRVEKDNQIVQGFKDNGEKGAGMRILETLVKHHATNVLVIVTRWYGGNPIGSSRYRHIVNSTLNSLRIGNKIL